MNAKKTLVLLVILVGCVITANAQSWRTNDAREGTYTSNDGWNATFGKTGNRAQGHDEFAIVIRNAQNEIVARGAGYFQSGGSVFNPQRTITFRDGRRTFRAVFSSETRFTFENRTFNFLSR